MADEHPQVSAGRATLYRLYDLGYEIDLARAAELVAPDAVGHRRPRRGEAAAIVTPRPPLTVELVAEPAVTAAIFDFGVVSMRLQLAPEREGSWADFVRFGAGVHNGPELRAELDRCVRELLERLRPAVVRPAIAEVTEEYIVFRAGKLCGPDGEIFDPSRLPADALARLLLNESRPLSLSALQDLLPHRFSYTAEDFVALTWESALVVEPDLHDEDVEYVLEFANAQLLELRVFDALLDAELPRLYDRVAAVRTASPIQVARPYRRLLAGAADPGGGRDGDHRAGGERPQGDGRRLSGAGVLRGAGDLPWRGLAARDRPEAGHHAGHLRDAERRVAGRAGRGAGDLDRAAHRAGGGAVVRPRVASRIP